MADDLQRFLNAQQSSFPTALSEIRNGHKESHWMWFIFPQLKGLGRSPNALYYGINGIDEAANYLEHPILGLRLIEISQILLTLSTNNATKIFGTPDDLKLHSCMTLFSLIPGADPVFAQVLQKFFAGKLDTSTLSLLDKF